LHSRYSQVFRGERSIKRKHPEKNIVVAFFPDGTSSAEAITRLRTERFFRSVRVSVSGTGKGTIRGHPHVVHLFSALLSALFFVISTYAGYGRDHTLLIAILVYFSGLLLGPRAGLALRKSAIRVYAARALPGEEMVVVQCDPRDTTHLSGLLRSVGSGEPALFVVRPYLPEPWRTMRRDRHLLSAEQLRLFATELAAAQNPLPPARPRESILHYLDHWERMIDSVRRDLTEAVELDESITPSAEWLLDNSYITKNHIQDIRRNLPRRFYEILPRVEGDIGETNLRILSLASVLAGKTDGNITAGSIFNLLSSYQGLRPLTTAELWIFPLMVRYVLIEDIAHQSLRVSRRQHDRERADFWADRLLNAARRCPERVPVIFAEITATVPVLEPHFLIRLIGQLSEEETAFSAAHKWLESRMDIPFPEMIRAEHARQTKKQVSIANDVTTLRRLTQLDWREIFESVSIVEAVLEQDSVYPASDFTTRDQCRRAVEQIARYSKSSEIDVAKKAIQLALEAQVERRRNAAFFLIDKGRKHLEDFFSCRLPFRACLLRWILEHAGPVYFSSISFITLIALGLGLVVAARIGLGFWALLGFAVVAVWPASEVAIQIVNYLLSLFVPPRLIPRMSFKSGIPDEFRTLISVPTMLLTPDSVKDEVDRLEVRYLANPEPNLLFALLTDFADSVEEKAPEDQKLFEIVLNGITELNARYGDRFFLFHRERTWCETEQRWIGWERKRGKLEDLNRFLNDEPREEVGPFLRAGNRIHLKEVRFVITLDADTELPHQSALHLVEAMAHPLNRPVICPDRRVVCEGYGLIQPRVVASLPAATASFFTSLFANAKGTDPYAQAISDLYQDLFGEGIFVGKAIYDLRAFHQVLSGRFPAQTLLSHDLIEGNYLRAGFDSRILLFESFPSSYEAFSHRQHRWIRGDWQIGDWMLPRVPDGNGRRERNPISAGGRWKIFDNLRRSLIAPACLAALVGSWLILPGSLFWNAFIGIALLVPALVPIPSRVREGAMGHLFVWRDQATELLRCFVTIALLPYQAWVSLDAIARVWFRRTHSRRNLLQWETAQATHWRYHRKASDLQWRTLVICLCTAAFALVLFYGGFSVWPAAVPYLTLWLISPAVSNWINTRKRQKRKIEWPQEERLFVRQLARETWRYFDDLVGAESHWLPPDNSQESIRVEVAYRSSPTNIGLWLLSAMAASDFEYITVDQLTDRLSKSFDSIDQLEKFRGHLLNWYDIKTLEPLQPRYVSTVDSGNLLASLWTLDQGLQDLMTRPVAARDCLEGIADTISILQKLCDSSVPIPRAAKNEIAELAASCRRRCGGLRETWDAVQSLAEASERLNSEIRGGALQPVKDHATAEEIAYWAGQVAGAVQSRAAMMSRYFGWVPLLISGNRQISIELAHLLGQLLDGSAPSLEEIAAEGLGRLSAVEQELRGIHDVPSEWVTALLAQIAESRRHAAEELSEIRLIVERSGKLQGGMSLNFLYDADRKLFSIGHEVSGTPQGSSYYDLLASEARLTSLIAIARGEVEAEHWQALGRPFGLFAGHKVLYSWSGSMFEYLMPLIFTRTFENSLLDHACCEAVAAQIEYGKNRGVPWGISESAFSALDANQIYQYRAFGVPALGLKRGLGDDLVIAPYSTALALMVDPLDAVENLKALEKMGLRGNKGFYESVDYSRESREGKHGAIVHAYMAHHQGMSFLSMANALFDSRMRKRFHSDLRVRSIESLLYEGIPPLKIVSYLSTTEERPPSRLIAMPVESVGARASTEKTPIPKTHLFSNGSYALMVTNSGGGYSRWREQDITRWRADVTRDHWGSYCFLRDLDTGVFWSTTYHPTDREDPGYVVNYHSDRVEYRNSCNGIESLTEVAVSPEDDVEVRRIVLVNRSGGRRRIELTTYSELALAPHAADRAHPAFSKLFVQTEILAGQSALIAFRKSSSLEEPRMWAGQILSSPPGLKAQYETSRTHFIGRGRSLSSPAAMSRDLSNSSGPVLDPVFSIRKEVTLEPGERARFAVITLAADSRENAMRLMGKYRDLDAVDRAFELAWTHSQLSFRYLQIRHEDAQRFQELAASLIYPNAGLRPGSERLRRNTLGQSRLWAFGISGDLPICVVVVSDPLDLGTVREALQAHTFLNERGLKSDLVILNSEAGGYDQPLQQKLIKMIQIHSVTTGVDKPGGVFLRAAEQLSGEDFTLILSVANVVLLASRGSLGRQLSSQPELPSYPPLLKPAAYIPEESGPALPMPVLALFNGSGGFNENGHEYVTYLEGDSTTPAPWINILANREFGSIVDETGQGTVWHLNSQLNRITPWHNDPVAFDSSSCIYMRDEESGVVWSPTAAPIREKEPYRVHHGQGYSRIEHNSHGVEHDLVIFVPAGDDAQDRLRIQRLKVRNLGLRKRQLTVTFFTEWVLGRDREETQLHVISNWDPVSRALLARNAYNSDFSRYIAFAAAVPAPASYTADRTEFLGRNRSAANPAALGRRYLSGRSGAGLDPCAALQVRVDLDPGQQSEIAFLLGQAEQIQDVRTTIDGYSRPGKVAESLRKTLGWWDRLLGTIQVRTPERAADLMLNRWLLYQTLSCRIWGRTALYQSGGAFGFRDQLQDVMALVYSRPEIAREQILRSASRQFVEGDVQHWWHPQSGAGVRTRCSDDLLWLPYAAAQYVQVTGDVQILEERIPFLECAPLRDGEMEAYSVPSISMSDGTLFEHCRRSVEKGFTTGAHGLPLIGLCDWNDGFNRVGIDGKGESVWLAWFLIEVLRGFRQLCIAVNQAGMADLCLARIRHLETAIEQNGWDGEWYRRAYFDDGVPLGSHANSECRIDSLAQSWSVLSGGAPEVRADQALQAVEEHLIRDTDKLILLFTPAFEHSDRDPGYVRAYPPGVRENGGQYTHAAIWVAMAFARQGNGKRAVELLRMLNPVELTRSPAGISRYRCEPYVLAGDVYSLDGHVGQGGWTWYTGSSSWMYRAWIEEVLGFRLRGSSLAIDPTIPAQWPGFEITYAYRTSVYRIHVDNPERTGRGIAWVELDGTRLQDGIIPLEDDGREHSVRVQLGRLRTAINY
jgi:cyclic beta-1,2-glucan synthetase